MNFKSSSHTLDIESVFPEGAAPIKGSVHEEFVKRRLEEVGKWGHTSFSKFVRLHARDQPGKIAYTDGTLSLTWAELDRVTDQYSKLFADLGLKRGDRVGIVYPDTPTVHALYLATERAGLIAVGISPRAGFREIAHLLKTTDSSALVSAPIQGKQDSLLLAERLRDSVPTFKHHVVIQEETGRVVLLDGTTFEHTSIVLNSAGEDTETGLGVGEIFLINSTSGTTGMPKCVVHNQNRWLFWVQEALKTAPLTSEDVFLSLVPSPYGFGIWSAHAVPIVLGATTVLQPKYETETAVRLIEEYKVSAMACVTTQFIKMLGSEGLAATDTSSLKVMYTGGEAIPYAKIVEFEESTGAAVLNFYGSNESGMLSYTTVDDPVELRRRTAGRIVPEMNVQLLDPAMKTSTERTGRSACDGPSASLGYYKDPEANAALFSDEGHLLTGDLCSVDDQGYLRVVGRTSSFIIRGGKNISEAAVEEAVGAHPAVAMVAAIGVPDSVYGERVRVVVELHPNTELDLESLKDFLREEEISIELWPEQIQIVERIPISSGGKVAKRALRQDVRTLREKSRDV